MGSINFLISNNKLSANPYQNQENEMFTFNSIISYRVGTMYIYNKYKILI